MWLYIHMVNIPPKEQDVVSVTPGSTIAEVAKISSLTEEQVKGFLLFHGLASEELDNESFRISAAVRQELFREVLSSQMQELIPEAKRPGWFVNHNSLEGNPPLSPAECLATGKPEIIFDYLKKRRTNMPDCD